MTTEREVGLDPRWSPGGKRLAFTRQWDPEGPNEKIVLYTSAADGRGAKALHKAAIS